MNPSPAWFALQLHFAERAAALTGLTGALTVSGVSWLHGIAAYRRLYPPGYGQSARPLPVEQVLPSMPLWGQFFDHADRVKEHLAAPFLACVARAGTVAELAACFPQQVYAVECDIAHFYRFYGVPGPVVPVP